GIRGDCDRAGAAGGVEFALKTLEIAAQIGGGLVTQFSVFFESFADDTLELSRKIGIKANRRDRRPVHDGFENDGGAFAAEGKLAGGHFVKHDAEGEKIAARVESLGADLFG